MFVHVSCLFARVSRISTSLPITGGDHEGTTDARAAAAAAGGADAASGGGCVPMRDPEAREGI